MKNQPTQSKLLPNELLNRKKENANTLALSNKNLDLIKKINLNLLTSDNSNYKQIKTNEIKNYLNIDSKQVNLEDLKNSSMNVFKKLKNIIQNKDNHEDENRKKMDVDQRMKLEKELLSISVRKKFDGNSPKKEIKYDRKTDFKNLNPLGISKSGKFVFEDNVSVKPNLKPNTKINEDFDRSQNERIKDFKNRLNNIENVSDKEAALKNNMKKKDALVFNLMNNNNKKVNFEDHKVITNLHEFYSTDALKNLRKDNKASKDKTNYNNQNIGEFFLNRNNLKNLDLLNYYDTKIINFDNNSNIQGVNKLSSYRMNLKDHLKDNKENQTERKTFEKSKTSVNFYKQIRRSKSISSFEKVELDPKTLLLNLFESKRDAKRAEKESKKQEKSSDELTAKQKLFLLESDFKSIFDKTQKTIKFKNNLFEKVEKIKRSRGLSNDNNNNNLIAKEDNKFANLNNTNKPNIGVNNASKENISSQLNSMRKSNAMVSSNSINKDNQKIFEKINDLNFNFNLNEKINQPPSNRTVNFKSALLNQEITFSQDSNKIENDKTNKLNVLSDFSSPSKNKLNEINSIRDNFRDLGEKDKKVESEQFAKNYRKISIEESKQELEENIYKRNFNTKKNEILGILSNNDGLSSENKRANFLEKVDKRKNDIMSALESLSSKGKIRKNN